MLDIKFIKANRDLVKERLAIRNFKELDWVDEIINLDERAKITRRRMEDTQMQVNSLSEEIPRLIKREAIAESETLKEKVMQLKQLLNSDKPALEQEENALRELLIRIPNLPSLKVPPGKTPEDNLLVRGGGKRPELDGSAVPHWDLAKKYNLIDFELGNKITGSGFPVYIGKGAKLQRALIQYFLDFNTAAGYTEYQPPLLVNEDSAFGTGQLPDKEGQMYYAPADKYYLIPTSEVPLTNMYRDLLLKENELPKKMTAYTPCFRREAGSYGKDVRGLNRLHQFDKVELVQLVHPDTSYEVLEEMVNHVEKLLEYLELPYRILKLCGGDMGFTAALTYDFEVYSAAQQKWLEVSSVSNFESYQTNRMKIRFKNSLQKSQLLHSLNGSSLALPRIVAALLENNQTAKGIELPAVLHPYFGASSITE